MSGELDPLQDGLFERENLGLVWHGIRIAVGNEHVGSGFAVRSVLRSFYVRAEHHGKAYDLIKSSLPELIGKPIHSGVKLDEDKQKELNYLYPGQQLVEVDDIPYPEPPMA